MVAPLHFWAFDTWWSRHHFCSGIQIELHLCPILFRRRHMGINRCVRCVWGEVTVYFLRWKSLLDVFVVSTRWIDCLTIVEWNCLRIRLVCRRMCPVMVMTGSLLLIRQTCNTAVHLLVQANCTTKMALAQTWLKIPLTIVSCDVMSRYCFNSQRFTLPLLFLLLFISCRLFTEWFYFLGLNLHLSLTKCVMSREV